MKIVTIIAGVQVDERECAPENQDRIADESREAFKIDTLKAAGVEADVFLLKESRLNYGNFEELDDKIIIQ